MAIAETNTVLKVVTEHWPPYNYMDEDGQMQGIATDLVTRTLNHAQIKHKIHLYGWNKSYKLAKEKPNVLLYTIYRLEHREKDFKWICPLIKTGDIKMFTLKSRKDIRVDNLDDAKQYVTGSVRTGSTFEHLVKKGFKPNIHIDVASDEMANVKKLLAGRIDLVVQQTDLLIGRVKRAGGHFNQLRAVYTFDSEGHKLGCMAMSTKTPDTLINRLQDSLNYILTSR